MDAGLHTHRTLAQFLADQLARLPQVEAVGLGGSVSAGQGEPGSDIDLYVFITAPIPIEERVRIKDLRGAAHADMGLHYFDEGDEWFDLPSGIEVDLILWDTRWMEEQLARVIDRHQPSLGYTTCFWHTMKIMEPLFDRNGWLQTMQQKANSEYPEVLRENIIQCNLPILHQVIPAFGNQIMKAVRRQDWVSVNHRLAAYLASYFDILFALNRQLHPGEKRLTLYAQQCALQPKHLKEHLEQLLSPENKPDETWLTVLSAMSEEITDLVREQGIGID